ncbi:MAG: OmpH family outer membrane protein [Bacteroidota bacterium]
MKQFSFVLNLILFIAVAVLYYLHFSKGEAAPIISAGKAPVAPGGIYFINSDTLLENYGFYKDKKAELESRQNRIRNELKSASQKLEQDVQNYQQAAPGMTDEQRQRTEESLMIRQQKLVEQKDQLLNQLDEEQAKYSDSLFTRLTAYLKSTNKDNGVRFVLGYQRGGGILFANDSLDITKSVLDGLNKEWKGEKK